MAIKEFNVDLDVKGRVLASTVPNSTGSIVTWNTTTNVFGLRTNTQIISDLNLSSNFITTNTTQTGLTGNKTSSGIWTLGQVRKAGQNDTQMLLAGGGHRPVSDFALKAHTHTFASLTSKPTTISGYGITDFNSLGDARWALRSRTITAGNGLTGGGTLAGNRTITLGTPTAIGLSTTNSVTSTSHTHALDSDTITEINKGQQALTNIGVLNNLTTTNKSNLVNAINEVNGKTSALDDFGGRNYALGTSDIFSNISWGSWNGYMYGMNQRIPVIGGETYTARVFLKTDITNDRNVGIRFFWYDANDVRMESVSSSFLPPATEGYVALTLEAPSTAVSCQVVLRTNSSGGIVNTVDFKEFKLEKGSIPTDWTPAPEDQVSDWNETNEDSFSFLKNKPTSLSDFTNDLGNYGNWITKAQGDTYYSAIGHTHTFASLTSKPTTIAGYGITDFNSLGDARYARRTRTISAGTGLTGGGNLTANRTIGLSTDTQEDIAKGVEAHGWGDFRDYGLGLSTNITRIYDGNEDSPNGFYMGGGDNAVNLPFNYRYGPILSLNRNTTNYKIAIYSSSLGFQDGNNNWYHTYHTGNFDPSNYYTINEALDQFVGLAGVQDIADTKTFLASPVVPTPALDAHAVNKEYVDDIEIGGRNLALNTSVEWKPLSWSSWYWNGRFIKYTEAKPNEIYTISIHLRNVEDSLGGAFRLWVYWLDENGDRDGHSFNGSLVYDEGISKATFTIPEWKYGFEATIRGTQKDSTKSCEYRMFKAEKGNKATDWSPAPEDQVTDWDETNEDSFSFLKNKPTKLTDFTNDAGYITSSSLPTVNNGQLTLSTGTGLSGSSTFTANQSGSSSFSVGIASTHKLPTVTEWNALSNSFVTKDNISSSALTTTVIDFDATGNGASILYAGASSTNRPNVSGTAGGLLMRGNHSTVGEYQLYIARGENDALLYRNQSGVWNRAASREWVNSQNFSTQTLSSSTSNIISGSTVQRAALTGDVTASQNSNVTTIANSAVTHAKYQNIATKRILGRGATGTGNVQELTLGSNLSLSTSGVLNASYSAGSLALLNAGTNTTNRIWGAKTIADYVKQYAAANLGLQGVTDIGNWTTNNIEVRLLNTSSVQDLILMPAGSSSNPAGNAPLISTGDKGFRISALRSPYLGTMADAIETRMGMYYPDISKTGRSAVAFSLGDGVSWGYSYMYNTDGSIGNGTKAMTIELDYTEHHTERWKLNPNSQELQFPPESGTLATREWVSEKTQDRGVRELSIGECIKISERRTYLIVSGSTYCFMSSEEYIGTEYKFINKGATRAIESTSPNLRFSKGIAGAGVITSFDSNTTYETVLREGSSGLFLLITGIYPNA